MNNPGISAHQKISKPGSRLHKVKKYCYFFKSRPRFGCFNEESINFKLVIKAIGNNLGARKTFERKKWHQLWHYASSKVNYSEKLSKQTAFLLTAKYLSYNFFHALKHTHNKVWYYCINAEVPKVFVKTQTLKTINIVFLKLVCK